jgi:peptidoglycan hydrolase-like protein with peptidoglycan-binding domain
VTRSLPRRRARARPRDSGRIAAVVAVGLCGLVVSGCAMLAGEPGRADAGPGAEGAPPTTAPVVEGDLVDSRKVPGTLGYGARTPLTTAGAGTVTALPGYGEVIPLDGVLYAVDERPVRALHGTVPLWRPLEAGIRGSDVDQLKDSLRALGHDVADDDLFDWRTAEAVRRWQADHDMTRTGVLDADDVAFVPGDIRVDEAVGRPGDAAGGVVYQYTSTTPVATGSVAPADLPRFAVGGPVDVTLPGGETLAGEVVSVGAPGDDAEGGGTGTAGDERVPVAVGLDDGSATDVPGSGSVSLVVEGERREGVLSVPIPALLAQADGYVVERLGPDGSVERVAVEIGFVAQGRVEVTGGGLSAGDDVVVPS